MTDHSFAFFRRAGDGFEPTPMAQSMWGGGQLHGVAIGGLLARAAEETVLAEGRSDLVPARFHVDLFRPARMLPTTTTAAVVRISPRLALVDTMVLQEDRPVARATTSFLLPTEEPPGRVWSSDARAEVPPASVVPESDEPRVPFFASAAPWSDNFGDHQNDGRHAVWHTGVPMVAGETPTPFQAVASIGDTTSMVTNWGSGGVEFINTDYSLALVRRPVGQEIGLRALDHVSRDGIAVGTAEVFDRAGPLGSATVTALANTRRTVDFGQDSGDTHQANPGA
ncbi:acyl-CoA thioesterase domain-containing protein [Nocardioides panacisoli]|uniref:Thioesterase family protein n=1 Tax=Nocardioides panacisoli TaxID=627624 RepID=A0ABP7IHJ1_9ACTN